MSRDPIGYDAGEANFYPYAGNSPVNRVDATGLWWGDWVPGLRVVSNVVNLITGAYGGNPGDYASSATLSACACEQDAFAAEDACKRQVTRSMIDYLKGAGISGVAAIPENLIITVLIDAIGGGVVPGLVLAAADITTTILRLNQIGDAAAAAKAQYCSCAVYD